MKVISLVVASLSLALASCGTTGLGNAINDVSNPIAVCDRTTSDEKAVIGLGLAYKGFRRAVELGVNVGTIKGELAGKIAAVDRTAFAAITNLDTVYRTCSGDLNAALDVANRAVNAAIGTIPINTDSRREQ